MLGPGRLAHGPTRHGPCINRAQAGRAVPGTITAGQAALWRADPFGQVCSKPSSLEKHLVGQTVERCDITVTAKLLRFYSLHRFVPRPRGRGGGKRGAAPQMAGGKGGKKGGASINESSSRGGTRATSSSSKSSGTGDAQQKKIDLAFQEASRRSIACRQTSISVCIYLSIPPCHLRLPNIIFSYL